MAFADDWDHWARSFPARIARSWRDFLEAIFALAETVVYVPDTVTLNTGSNTAGDVDSVKIMNDSDTYDVDEVTGVPGFDIEFTFSDVVDFTRIWLHVLYNGSTSHVVNVQLYNYDTTSWDTITSFTDQTVMTWIDRLVTDDTDYIDSGAVKLRLYHVTSGNAAHDISVDYVAIAKAGYSASSDLDYDDISTNDSSTDVTGAELEELTDGSETTLHSHPPTQAAVVPHYSAGSGDWNVLCHGTFYVYVNGTVKVTAFDLVRSVQGGAASPTYTFYVRKAGDSFGAGSSDPKDEYVTYTSSDAGANAVEVKVSDGTTTSTETVVQIVVTN